MFIEFQANEFLVIVQRLYK